MNQYDIEVTFTATKIFTIEAGSHDLAHAIARANAYETLGTTHKYFDSIDFNNSCILSEIVDEETQEWSPNGT